MSKKRIALILSSLLGIFLISACILWHCSQSEDKRFEAFLSSFFCFIFYSCKMKSKIIKAINQI